MKIKDLFSNNPEKLYHVHFGPVNLEEKNVKFDKELFLAEYNSLRQEILQRLSQQTTITQIAFTAWAAILAVAIRSSDAGVFSHINNLFNTIFIILVYPLLAYFISFSWAFQNSRICQIGNYLRKREEEVSKVWGILYWERHILNQDLKSKNSENGKLVQGITIFLGTQIAAILIALFILILTILYFNHPELIPGYESLDLSVRKRLELNVTAKSYFTSISVVVLILILNSLFTFKTYFKIKNSGLISE
jgi:hypothetical protein